MIRVGHQGFTVIELILFLAVSGALMTGLLFGVNANISQQRYQDSARSLHSLLQQQYFDVQNTTNVRDMSWRCTESGIEAVEPERGQARGTTECLLLGRYVSFLPGGLQIESGAIVGREPSEVVPGGDLAVLAQHSPRISPVDVSTVDIDWQSRLRTGAGDTPPATIIFLQSPTSGVLRTFIIEGELSSADVAPLLTAEAAKRSFTRCIDSGSPILGPTWSVRVQASVANTTGVTLNENDEEC